MAEAIENPILNGPYDPPSQHFELSSSGPTGNVVSGRRESESFIPVPPPKKGQKDQQSFDLDASGERRQKNDLINEIRYQVTLWRQRGYPHVTPITRKLLLHWADPERENRVMFCQREAVETAIFLTEAANKVSGGGGAKAIDFRARLDAENARHNADLPRMALKMATGSGKTVVMAMLIAWQTINKSFTPRDVRFANRFLVVAPGITIRDRLRVIRPSDPANYYKLRDLVPADLWSPLQEAQIVLTNYHAFLPRTVKEMKGVSATTKKILTHGKDVDPFVESDDQIVSRVLRDFGGRSGKGRSGEIVVLNDEAHHCYRDKPVEDGDADGENPDRDDKSRNEDARVWFKGLVAVKRKLGIKSVFDLSATPYYLKGSGYNEGFIFPWTVSDFSLMDAIESGIVKVPKVPVDDNATNTLVTYLRLWDHIGDKLPKRAGKGTSSADWIPPDTLEGAMRSLYASYSQAFHTWQAKLEPFGEPPPVMIVVCPNTVVSKLVFDWIAGLDIHTTDDDGEIVDAHVRPGNLDLLSNVVDGRWLNRPRSVLIDSAQLESGEAIKKDFKEAASREIEQFKDDIRRRTPGANVDDITDEDLLITDEDLLREVMNTVGKKGRLGEQIRCVVSVSMLTEGWDANTVSHILGVRAFRSQLLCEQVVGRGLRRRSYELNEHGMFDAEYAEVYGVPFAFIPTDRPAAEVTPRPPAVEVHTVEDRSDLRITFPRLSGYRIELTPEPLFASFDTDSELHIDRTTVATITETGGVVGEQGEHRLDDQNVREQQVAYELAKHVVTSLDLSHDSVPVHTRFPQIVKIAKQWVSECLTFEPGCELPMLLQFAELRTRAAERIHHSIVKQEDGDGNLVRSQVLQPVFRSFDHVGSTDGVSFFTRKVVFDSTKSPINRVTLDGIKGNSWEEAIAIELENDDRVKSYVKNDHLQFAIPYVHAGRSHEYVTDFLVRLNAPSDDDIERTLIVEVSGGRKNQALREVKAQTTRDQWCVAVNNHGGFGIWDFVEIDDMTHAVSMLDGAIERLLADPLTRALAD